MAETIEISLAVEQSPINKIVEQISKIIARYPEIFDITTVTTTHILLRTTARALHHLGKKDMMQNHPEDMPLPDKPTCKPYSQILYEGITNFQKTHPDIPVVFNRSPEYQTNAQLFTTLTSKKTTDNPNDSVLEIAFQMFRKGFKFGSIEGVIVDSLPPHIADIIRRSEGIVNASVNPDYEEKVDLKEIGPIIERIYEQQESKTPLSVSQILPIFLEKTSGDLSASLYCMTAFFKSQSRGLGVATKDNTLMQNASAWFKKYIADEYYSLVPYQGLDDVRRPYPGKLYPKIAGIMGQTTFGGIANEAEEFSPADHRPLYYDYLSLNQVGKPYHAANIVALLECLPPEAVAVLTAAEFVSHSSKHGINKALADVMILIELREIDKLFQRFSPKVANSLLAAS